MITPAGNIRVFLVAEPVDFRKGMDGLAGLVAGGFGHDPYDGSIYVFRSRRADRLKLIVWDGTGTILLTKRLDGGRFVWVRKRIDRMYRIEKKLVGLPPAAREVVRQDETLPILSEIRAELTMKEGHAHGALKMAITYTLNAFEALQRFAFDGRLEIDNNPVERCMRLIALTKKNSIGAGSHDAAEAWAIYFTLIENARMNRGNPRAYMTWVVGEIESSRGQIDYSVLMPWHCPVGRLDS